MACCRSWTDPITAIVSVISAVYVTAAAAVFEQDSAWAVQCVPTAIATCARGPAAGAGHAPAPSTHQSRDTSVLTSGARSPPWRQSWRQIGIWADALQ